MFTSEAMNVYTTAFPELTNLVPSCSTRMTRKNETLPIVMSEP